MEIKRGEILGVIGANGAGKSTLLKILSRVTTPTSGLVKIKGKIASLLEVGTGFHTELTGRENIYLNGSINGMKHNEVTKKLHGMMKNLMYLSQWRVQVRDLKMRDIFFLNQL